MKKQNSIFIENGIPLTTTLIISERFGRKHRHVLRSLRDLMDKCPDNFIKNFIPNSYTDTQNRTMPFFKITRNGYMLFGMGFSGKGLAQIKIDLFNEFNNAHSSMANARIAQNIKQELLRSKKTV